MKKIFYAFAALAVMASFSACEKEEGKNGLDLDNIVLDGFYVYGPATGSDKVTADFAMSAGSNEVEKKVRTGMFEKYIWLEANKDFSLIENSAGVKKFYGAELVEVNYKTFCRMVLERPKNAGRLLMQQAKRSATVSGSPGSKVGLWGT